MTKPAGKILLYFFILFIYFPLAAAPSATLTLEQAVALAKSHSALLEQSKVLAVSAEADAERASDKLYPKLSLDGGYKYQSVLPETILGRQTLKIGDNNNYSIGPALSYVLWDSGNSRNQIKSLEFLSKAKYQQFKLSEIQLRLTIQIAYLQAVVSKEIADSSARAEQLAQVQNRDVQAKKKGGSASELDALISDSEILSYSLKAKQSWLDFDVYLQDLVYYTGQNIDSLITFQTLAEMVDHVVIPTKTDMNHDHPVLLIPLQMEKSTQYSLDAQKSSYWPIILLQARSSLDYPNFQKLEEINQNTLSVNFTWMLFDFGETKSAVRSKYALLDAARASVQEAKNSLARDIGKIKSKITHLRDQITDAEKLVEKQTKLAKTNYSAYKYGSIKYSDVQSANLRLLETEKNLALLRTQYLGQVFTLQYLTEGNNHE